MKTKRLDQRGSVIILTAAAMIAMVGFAALAVDGGFLYFRRARLQDIADAAALAAGSAAARIHKDRTQQKSAAFGAVVEYMELNGLQMTVTGDYAARVSMSGEPGEVLVTFPEERKIQVNLGLDADLYFARVLSKNRARIGVSSTAYIFREPQGMVPIAFFQEGYVPMTKYDMTLAPGDGVCGNYGFLDFRPPNLLEEFLENGFHGSIRMGDLIMTFPGVKEGRIKSPMSNRLAGCTHGCSIVDLDGNNDGVNVQVNVEPNCPRLIVLPTVSGFYEAQGRGWVTVTGFLKFFIEAYDTKNGVLRGWCLGPVTENEANGITGVVEFVKLVR